MFTFLIAASSSAQIQYRILRSFAVEPDGRLPYAGLIQASDGFLYGTCEQGGADGKGTAFKMGTNGLDYMVLHSFVGTDGSAPLGRLCAATNGLLYGTTSLGGDNAAGTLFRVGRDGSGFQVIHHFGGSLPNGSKPEGGVVQGQDGNLYGLTRYGGANDLGALFRVSLEGANYTNIVTFDSNLRGKEPRGQLSLGVDGRLYGSTHYGGTSDFGVLFSVLPSGSNFLALHRFSNSDGRNPYAPPQFGPDGALYGTTYYGGGGDAGVIYKLAPAGTNFQVLHEFAASGTDGRNPVAGLVTAADGLLYGSTYFGGDDNAGALFRLDTSGTGYTRIVSFRATDKLDGISPNADLVLGQDRLLYGSTRQGGDNGYGVIFRVTDPTIAGVTGGNTTSGAATGGGTSSGSSGLARLDWVVVVKRPKLNAKIPGQSRGVPTVRGRVEKTGLPRRFAGVEVQMALVPGSTNVAPQWESATKVGRVNRRGKAKFRGKTVGQDAGAASGAEVVLLVRASTNFLVATSPTNRVTLQVR